MLVPNGALIINTSSPFQLSSVWFVDIIPEAVEKLVERYSINVV